MMPAMPMILVTLTLTFFSVICIALVVWGIKSRRRTRY